MSKIRNIMQTTMSREIIKMAPDMVIYMDGVPFIIHPYLTDNNEQPLVVNFNDYLTSVATNYAVDQMIPSGAFTLSVPNGSKHLFKAPGGGLIIDVMSDIQIFAKSYFFSNSSKNTVYRRIFNGLVKSVDYNELNTSLEITVNIVGILHLFEMTRIALAPGLTSASSAPVTPLTSNQGSLNPLQALQDTFVRGVDFSDVQISSLVESNPKFKGSPIHDAILHNFIDKWSLKLSSIWKYVHIFGLKEMGKPSTTPQKTSSDTERRGGNITPLSTAAKFWKDDYLLNSVRVFTFDMGIGQLNIANATSTSRLERVRTLADMITYEAYQDLDGSIIFKPPLYNLDPTILGETDFPELAQENLSEATNPYIINLSEVLSEGYSEDESAIRRTRMSLQGNYNRSGIQYPLGTLLTPVADYIDINLTRKFGMRDEAPKQMLFLTTSAVYNMAFAAAELAKINLGFRTYHVTIPLRPELRLGFPIFVPHLDMYAYVSGISVSYTVGGRADMSITCRACRKRPQFPIPTTLKDGRKVITYESIPNLVHKWVTGKSTIGTDKWDATSTDIFVTPGTPPTPGTSDISSYVTLPQDDEQVRSYLAKKVGSLYEVFSTSPTANWRIQNDDKNVFGGVLTKGQKTPKIADAAYMSSIRHIQPYTDEKGYEVISPLPWGRYTSLREALFIFTKGGILESTRGTSKKQSENLSIAQALSNSTNALVTAKLNSVSPFLLTGLAAPNQIPTAMVTMAAGSTTSVTKGKEVPKRGKEAITRIINALATSSTISFELDYKGVNKVGADNPILNRQINDILKNQTTSKFTNQSDFYTQVDIATKTNAAKTADRTKSFLSGIEGAINGLASDLSAILNVNETGVNSNNNDISLLPQTSDLGYYKPGTSLSGSIAKLGSTFSNFGKI